MLHDKSPWRRKLEQVLIRWLTALVAWLARITPLRWLHGLGNAVGWLIYRALRVRRRLGLDNLRRALGPDPSHRELERILLSSTRNMVKTMLELFKLGSMTDDEFFRFAQVRGAENLQAAAARGQGVVLVTPHYGCWEGLAASIARLGFRLTVVARDANDPGTAQLIRRAREAAGERIIERNEIREMLRVLRAGEVLGILPDQHGGRNAVWVTFMGRPARTAQGPASLALRTGAAIVPAFARRLPDDTIEVCFHPALELPVSGDRQADVRRVTQLINDVMEAEIRRHPEQWMWMHNRWRPPPPDVFPPDDAGAQNPAAPPTPRAIEPRRPAATRGIWRHVLRPPDATGCDAQHWRRRPRAVGG